MPAIHSKIVLWVQRRCAGPIRLLPPGTVGGRSRRSDRAGIHVDRQKVMTYNPLCYPNRHILE